MQHLCFMADRQCRHIPVVFEGRHANWDHHFIPNQSEGTPLHLVEAFGVSGCPRLESGVADALQCSMWAGSGHSAVTEKSVHVAAGGIRTSALQNKSVTC